jgi:hypothetical protein
VRVLCGRWNCNALGMRACDTIHGYELQVH